MKNNHSKNNARRLNKSHNSTILKRMMHCLYFTIFSLVLHSCLLLFSGSIVHHHVGFVLAQKFQNDASPRMNNALPSSMNVFELNLHEAKISTNMSAWDTQKPASFHNIRGGSLSSLSSNKQKEGNAFGLNHDDGQSVTYSTLGFIHLTNHDRPHSDPQKEKTITNNRSISSSPSAKIFGRWIKNKEDMSVMGRIGALVVKNHIDNDHDTSTHNHCLIEGNLYAPIEAKEDGDELYNFKRNQVMGDFMECVGCVADKIVICIDFTKYDGDDDDLNQQLLRQELLLRFKAGLKRQNASVQSKEEKRRSKSSSAASYYKDDDFNDNKKEVTVMVLVIGEENEEHNNEDSPKILEIKNTFLSIQNELNQNRNDDTIVENDKAGGLELNVQVTPLQSLYNEYGGLNDKIELSSTGTSSTAQEKDVPILYFDRFIQSILSNISDDHSGEETPNVLFTAVHIDEEGNIGADETPIQLDLDEEDIEVATHDNVGAIMHEDDEEEKVMRMMEPDIVGDKTKYPSPSPRTSSLGNTLAHLRSDVMSDAEKRMTESLPNENLRTKLTHIRLGAISTAEKRFANLETKQDNVLLHSDTRMPILEFGSDAEQILKEASSQFDFRDSSHREIDLEFIEERRKEVLLHLVGDSGLLPLYQIQLQSLREYYGRRYESVLEQLDDEASHKLAQGIDASEKIELRKKHDAILAEAAKQASEGFRVAAQNAMPPMITNGTLKGLVDGYSFLPDLDGLIKDMMHAISSRNDLEDEWEEVNSLEEDANEGMNRGRGKKARVPVKWYEKVAARAVVFGVNYLQGWLAMQGIRKAAAERDQMMPKFPLF